MTSKNPIYISTDKIREISRDMFNSYSSFHIRFSGGEPFVYPNFIEFLRIFSEYHSLEVSTNLSIDVGELKDKLDPASTLLLSASFHPEFANIDGFLKKVLSLKNNGFFVAVTVVAYPPLLKQMRYYKEIIEKNNIQLIIQPFVGKFNGRKYPDEYTDAEKMLLNDYTKISLTSSINKMIVEHKMNIQEEKTKICRMGQMYVKVDRFGNIFRCCAKDNQKLGNILDSGLELLSEPLPCEVQSCPCWKAMIVGKEENWVNVWNYPRHAKQYIPTNENKS